MIKMLFSSTPIFSSVKRIWESIRLQLKGAEFWGSAFSYWYSGIIILVTNLRLPIGSACTRRVCPPTPPWASCATFFLFSQPCYWCCPRYFLRQDPKNLAFYASSFRWNPCFHFLLGTRISSVHCFELWRTLKSKWKDLWQSSRERNRGAKVPVFYKGEEKKKENQRKWGKDWWDGDI